MAAIGVEMGPTNLLAGQFPSAVEDRSPVLWLVYGPTSVFACRAASSDEAKALVLWSLRDDHRPELAEGLTARNATDLEIAAVCRCGRQTHPLRVSKSNRRRIGETTAEVAFRDRTGGARGEDRDMFRPKPPRNGGKQKVTS